MLVLTRKLHEQISIGQDITITVLRLKGNSVRIGIEAPRNVRVVRGELPRYEGSHEASADHSRSAPATSDAGPSTTPKPDRRGRARGLRPILEQRGLRDRNHQAEMSSGVASAVMVAR